MSYEDDIKKSKDDLGRLSMMGGVKNNKKNIYEVGCNPEEREWSPPGLEVGNQPPPTPTMVVGPRLTRSGIKKGDARTGPRTTRADNTNVKKGLTQGEDARAIDTDTKNCVSVRGVKVKEDIMKKRYLSKKTLLSSKKKKKNNEEEKVRTTPAVNKISQYLVRKIEDNPSKEDDRQYRR